MNDVSSPTSHGVPQLLLKPEEAAKALAICPRVLWGLTDEGGLRCIRIGRSVRYDPRDLIAWIDTQKSAGGEA